MMFFIQDLKTRRDILQALERPDVKSFTTTGKRSWLLNRGADQAIVNSVLKELDEQTRVLYFQHQ